MTKNAAVEHGTTTRQTPAEMQNADHGVTDPAQPPAAAPHTAQVSFSVTELRGLMRVDQKSAYLHLRTIGESLNVKVKLIIRSMFMPDWIDEADQQALTALALQDVFSLRPENPVQLQVAIQLVALERALLVLQGKLASAEGAANAAEAGRLCGYLHRLQAMHLRYVQTW